MQMVTLADMGFDGLQAGMKFRHSVHGEQIVLDLYRNQLGPVVRLHDSHIYGGQLPQMTEQEQGLSMFQLMAKSTFPHGAQDWEYLGTVGQEEIAAHGWHWFEVTCPQCGFAHRLLAVEAPSEQRRCRACGMKFDRDAQPAQT